MEKTIEEPYDNLESNKERKNLSENDEILLDKNDVEHKPQFDGTFSTNVRESEESLSDKPNGNQNEVFDATSSNTNPSVKSKIPSRGSKITPVRSKLPAPVLKLPSSEMMNLSSGNDKQLSAKVGTSSTNSNIPLISHIKDKSTNIPSRMPMPKSTNVITDKNQKKLPQPTSNYSQISSKLNAPTNKRRASEINTSSLLRNKSPVSMKKSISTSNIPTPFRKTSLDQENITTSKIRPPDSDKEQMYSHNETEDPQNKSKVPSKYFSKIPQYGYNSHSIVSDNNTDVIDEPTNIDEGVHTKSHEDIEADKHVENDNIETETHEMNDGNEVLPISLEANTKGEGESENEIIEEIVDHEMNEVEGLKDTGDEEPTSIDEDVQTISHEYIEVDKHVENDNIETETHEMNDGNEILPISLEANTEGEGESEHEIIEETVDHEINEVEGLEDTDSVTKEYLIDSTYENKHSIDEKSNATSNLTEEFFKNDNFMEDFKDCGEKYLDTCDNDQKDNAHNKSSQLLDNKSLVNERNECAQNSFVNEYDHDDIQNIPIAMPLLVDPLHLKYKEIVGNSDKTKKSDEMKVNQPYIVIDDNALHSDEVNDQQNKFDKENYPEFHRKLDENPELRNAHGPITVDRSTRAYYDTLSIMPQTPVSRKSLSEDEHPTNEFGNTDSISKQFDLPPQSSPHSLRSFQYPPFSGSMTLPKYRTGSLSGEKSNSQSGSIVGSNSMQFPSDHGNMTLPRNFYGSTSSFTSGSTSSSIFGSGFSLNQDDVFQSSEDLEEWQIRKALEILGIEVEHGNITIKNKKALTVLGIDSIVRLLNKDEDENSQGYINLEESVDSGSEIDPNEKPSKPKSLRHWLFRRPKFSKKKKKYDVAIIKEDEEEATQSESSNVDTNSLQGDAISLQSDISSLQGETSSLQDEDNSSLNSDSNILQGENASHMSGASNIHNAILSSSLYNSYGNEIVDPSIKYAPTYINNHNSSGYMNGHRNKSSPGKVDRVYKGPSPGGRVAGPPNLQKSHSTDAPQHIPQHHHHNHNNLHHNDNNHVRRPQVMSQSSVLGNTGRRGSGHNQTTDDSNTGRRDRNGRWGGNNTNSQCYELSQDLADMRLEMLEKRYGGEVARRAAVTIQRAYRHYMMAKKFRTITANAKAQEKRWSLSRRFTVDVPEWDTNGQTNGQTNNQQDYLHNTEQIIRSEFDSLQRNLKNTVYGEGRHRPQRSQSVRDTPRGTNITNTNNNNNTTLNSNEFDLDTSQGLTSVTDSSLYCPSSTTSSDSPLTPTSTPTPPGGQNHKRNDSADFHHNDSQSYVSSKPLNFSSDESGFGSVEGSVVGRSSVCRRSAAGSGHKGKKVPPSVPQRSSSIKSNESGSGSSLESSVTRQQCQPPSLTPPSSTPTTHTYQWCYSERGSLRRSGDNGSLSSVQSSGSDSSLSQSASDRATPVSQHDTTDNADYHPTSPVWKRKNQSVSQTELIYDDKRLSNISENSEDSLQSHGSGSLQSHGSDPGLTYSHNIPNNNIPAHTARYASSGNTGASTPKVPEVVRKRQYRVGLNLFNKKPEKGITYLINRGFLENSPQAVAKFLLTRKGLSKQMIGEYLGNLQNNFNMAVLECFAQEIDLSGMQVDVALRKFQTYYRMPGEAQKIERLMQVFAQRYCQCNRDIVAKLRDPETIFVMAFAIIMLNTDLHTSSMKAESRMKPADFIKNLRGIDDGYDIEKEMLEGMYQRIKTQEFKTGHDHVTQVLKVQQTMVGKKPNLALPHRRLVCYCRLYEIPDISKKERVGVHQREVFLFNDLLVVTKIFSKKKNSVTYTFRQSFPLAGLAVSTKETAHYPYLMEIRQRVDNKLLMTFNARNEHDRSKFCEDLKESVCEMDEMESLRIEGELERQKASLRASRPSSTAENRDSGVADMEILTTSEKNSTLKPDSTLKRSALSNSLLDIHEAVH